MQMFCCAFRRFCADQGSQILSICLNTAISLACVDRKTDMRRRFHTLDVFTDTRLAGNPLAVVHDSEGLDTAAMQAITREFNLSETVFVFPPNDPVNTARIRIFTPGAELPFAGHPTVGTAVLLGLLRAPEHVKGAGIVIALEETIGLIKVDVQQRPGRAARGLFALPRLPVALDYQRDPHTIATALGVTPEDIDQTMMPPSDFSGGVPYTIVCLTSLDALARAQSIDGPAFDSAFGGSAHPAVYLCVKEGPLRWRTRMFAPTMGMKEDPATGSAAAAFAGAIMAHEKPGDGQHQHVITQGVEMDRPSEIVLTLSVQHQTLVEATIGGGAVMVSEGTIDV
jgi:trans-2,3-dihydro-3-hydroxyanthranilate isomerase